MCYPFYMAFPKKYEGPDRRKYTTFRLLAVLQFGKYKDLLEVKEGGEVRIYSIAKLARKVHMRPVRLREALEWLHESGYLSACASVGLGYSITLVQPPNIVGHQVEISR